MDIQSLNEIFTADFNIDSVVSMRQSQPHGAQYSFFATTRQINGLLLMRDYGAVITHADGTSFTANPGDILLLPKDARYWIHFQTKPGDVAKHVMINFRLTSPTGEPLFLGDRLVPLGRDDGTFLPLFTATAQLYKGGSLAKLKAKVFELLGTLFPVVENDECAIAYIGRHYTDRFSIPALAEKCAMSETAYRKRFRQITGQSPVQYITKLKIEKACQMLTGSDMRLNDISDFLNFYSPAYFYKIFRAQVGMTPKAYRNQQKNDL